MNKVCSRTATWIFVLMLIVPGSVLSAEDPPSARDKTVREAQPVASMPVPPGLHQALASPLAEAASLGAKAIPTPPTGSWGIVSEGDGGGGIFRDSDSEAEAWLGTNGHGVEGFGTVMGGYFKDSDHSGYAYVANGNFGIGAYGDNGGGYFEDTNSSGIAFVGYGDYGIQANGNSAGGYFYEANGSGYAYVGTGEEGIRGSGNSAGGSFWDLDSSNYAYVGFSTYKISGPGTVSFVQNHPYDHSSVIVYAAPEGGEVATYTRGTARLVDGKATVPLGETFKWVTNPDIGLTAHLTPREDCNGVYLADLSTQEIVVRELQNGTSDCAFDFLVYGLRIGFEELSIVQEKKQESYIPSMADHRQLYERRPDLKVYNSLERFKGMHLATNPKARIDLSRAQALRNAIVEFDPAIHELPMPPGHEEMPIEDLAREEAEQGAEQRIRAARADQGRRLSTDHPGLNASIPEDNEGNVYSSQDLASLVDVSEEVQPGDVLVVDTERRGLMRRSSRAADNGVVGIVAATPGVVFGSEVEISGTEALEEREPSADFQLKAPVAFSGVVDCKVDASYGAVWTGNLLVTSPTPGHAMAQQAPLPGTVLGKALEPLEKGVGTIKVLVMLR